MKVAFVIPWYGKDIPGGAEAECYRTVMNLKKRGTSVEVLTTCARDFYSWSNDHKAGVYDVEGIKVRRFRVNKRDARNFDSINLRLMSGMTVTPEEEVAFLRESINSEDLYRFIGDNAEDYLYIFIPYMFGTTYYGAAVCPERSYVIPCLHDESYAYMDLFKEVFRNVKGMIFHSRPEVTLGQKLYDLRDEAAILLGEGVDTDVKHSPQSFRKKFSFERPFILYAGRKDESKNTPLLIHYFLEYKRRTNNDLALVLIGSGSIEESRQDTADIIDLGFVSQQDKLNAHAAALMLCQPSLNESFSLVIMDSWGAAVPVIVSEKCEVTKDHCLRSNGGLFFDGYIEFEECVNILLTNPGLRQKLGANGREYVMSNFTWENITNKYKELFSRVES
jgi:glycosyltransferase involved in cell wall biosynthesis